MTKKIDMESITQRLNYILEILKLSEQDVSDKAGIPRSTLKNVLRGANKPRLDTIAKIALNFNISIDWIAFGGSTDNMWLNVEDEADLLAEANLKQRHTNLQEVKKYLSIRLEEDLTNQILKDMISTTISDGKSG